MDILSIANIVDIIDVADIYYGASTDGTVMELKTDVMDLLWTLVRGSAKALALYI